MLQKLQNLSTWSSKKILQRMIESTIFPQKGREKCILPTNQAEIQHSTKIKTNIKERKMKTYQKESRGRTGSGVVLQRMNLVKSQRRRAQMLRGL